MIFEIREQVSFRSKPMLELIWQESLAIGTFDALRLTGFSHNLILDHEGKFLWNF